MKMDIEPVKVEHKKVTTYRIVVHGQNTGVGVHVDETGTAHLWRYFEIISNRQEIGKIPFGLLPALRVAIDGILEAANE